jgi:hypothetical protein
MAIVKSSTVSNQTPAPVPFDQATVTVVETINLTAAQVAANNVIELGILPAGCVPISYVLAADDLDSGATVTMDLGIVNSGETAISAATADGGSKWVTASTLAQAGGLLLSTASKAAYDIVKAVTPVDANRIVGVVFPAGSTGQAGKLRLELSYAPARP